METKMFELDMICISGAGTASAGLILTGAGNPLCQLKRRRSGSDSHAN